MRRAKQSKALLSVIRDDYSVAGCGGVGVIIASIFLQQVFIISSLNAPVQIYYFTIMMAIVSGRKMALNLKRFTSRS